MRRRSVCLFVAVAVAAFGTGACRGFSSATCEELRADLAELDLSATAAWDDVDELKDDVERGLRLQRTIDERCEVGE